jgi:serine/threonine protein kinase
MTSGKQTDGPSDANLRPGQMVGGNYRIDRLIGKGGMAAVWECTNQRTGKRVALMAILNASATPAVAAEMLRREALASSRVNHPNVVNIYDVIDHEHLTCIVMEMLDGEPMSAYLARKGFLGVEEAATLLLPAMRGVAAANAMGVIHRDLKPQNIFLCIGSDGRLLATKVLDFGIAVVIEKTWGSVHAAQLLPTHGTPAYMSPEHIQGLSDIDGRADVYGFGVLLFEALTGQLPFLGEPGPALLARIVSEPAPKVTLFRPDLPPPIAAMVERALAKDPAARFPGLDHFIAALEEFLLPSSLLPRALTPMAGVPLFAHSEPRSGIADAVVQLAHRSEPSGPRELTDTKELYRVKREAEGTGGVQAREVVLVTGAAQAPPVAVQASPRSSSGREFRGLLAKRAMSFAMFAGVLLLVAWLAFPNAPRQQDVDEPASGGLLRRGVSVVGEAAPAGSGYAPAIPPLRQALAQPDGGS